MIKATQAQVIQSTNDATIQMRVLEINYFNKFFTTFGIQAAVLGGSVINGIAMCPTLPSFCNVADDDSIYAKPACNNWQYVLCIASVLCFVTTTYILLSTVYVSIFGQSLALRGPLGSMVRAVDGMVKEQQETVQVFALSIITFAIFAISLYFMMMIPVTAWICTIFTLYCCYLWFYYSRRIYNRFYDDAAFETAEWRGDGQSQSLDSNDPFSPLPPSPSPSFSSVFEIRSKSDVKPAAASHSPSFSSPLNGTANRVMGWMGFKGKEKEGRGEGGEERTGKSKPREARKDVFHGHICLRNKRTRSTPSVSSSDIFSGWEKRYGVVRGHKLILYESKQIFQLTPQKPLRRRPLLLQDFELTVDPGPGGQGMGMGMGQGSGETFLLTLTPSDPEDDRLPLQLLALSPSEAALWIEVLMAGIERGKKEENDDEPT